LERKVEEVKKAVLYTDSPLYESRSLKNSLKNSRNDDFVKENDWNYTETLKKSGYSGKSVKFEKF